MVDRRLKERLIGAVVLVLLAVIFLPMILQDQDDRESSITGSNIPARPDTEFSSRLIPLADPKQDSTTLSIPAQQDRVAEVQETGTATVQPEDKTTAAVAPAKTQPVADATVDTEQDTGTSAAGNTAAAAVDRGMTAWVVQIGSFSSKENAANLDKKLRDKGYRSYVQPATTSAGKTVYKVRVGPEILRSDALELKKKLEESMSLSGIIMSYP